MTPKVLAALLALAVSMAANAPGRLPASGLRSLTNAGTNSQVAVPAEPGEVSADAGISIAEWLDRAEAEMNAGRSAWSQFDYSTLDLPIGASIRFNGERTDDTSHALFASASFEGSNDNPGQLIRLAALDPLRSNQIPGGYGQRLGAFDSLTGSTGGTGGGGATGDEISAGAGDRSSKQEGSSPTEPTVKEPTVPTDTRPIGPTGTEPTVPIVPGLTVPTGTEPTVPTVTEPTGPTVTELTEPTATEPTWPIVTEQTVTRPVSVPEPASMGLLGLGLIGLTLARRRREAARA